MGTEQSRGVRAGAQPDQLQPHFFGSLGSVAVALAYLAGVKYVFIWELVGYAMDARMTQTLTATALWKAVRNKRLRPD